MVGRRMVRGSSAAASLVAGKGVTERSGGTDEVYAAGSPMMAALLWLVAEDEEENVGAV